MHWVWNRSRTKGNARLVVLAVADKAVGPDCTARIGTTEFTKRLNCSRSTAIDAVDKAIAQGELRIVTPAAGSRAATYQVPGAVGYDRDTEPATGPETRPQRGADRSGNPTASSDEGSENRTPNPEGGSEFPTTGQKSSGPESGPGGSEFPTTCGPESGPLNHPTYEGKLASKPDPARELITDGHRRDLVDQMTTAGVLVRWNLSAADWQRVDALIARSGATALAAYAARIAARRDVTYATYFVPGWHELPPLPAAGTGRPQLRAVGGTSWQPYTNPADPSVYENGF